MTVDEELESLDDALRRLKVEYDVFFGGGSRKKPADLEWRVQSLIKRFSDSQKLNFAQRFKYNAIAQRYAIFSELWRQKLRIKEEGYRRPEDAALSIQGLRTEEERAAAHALKAKLADELANTFLIECRNVEREPERVRLLFDAMMQAKQRTGDPNLKGQFDSFLAFIKSKTEQLREEFHCERVEFRVELRDQRVRLVARAVR